MKKSDSLIKIVCIENILKMNFTRPIITWLNKYRNRTENISFTSWRLTAKDLREIQRISFSWKFKYSRNLPIYPLTWIQQVDKWKNWINYIVPHWSNSLRQISMLKKSSSTKRRVLLITELKRNKRLLTLLKIFFSYSNANDSVDQLTIRDKLHYYLLTWFSCNMF